MGETLSDRLHAWEAQVRDSGEDLGADMLCRLADDAEALEDRLEAAEKDRSSLKKALLAKAASTPDPLLERMATALRSMVAAASGLADRHDSATTPCRYPERCEVCILVNGVTDARSVLAEFDALPSRSEGRGALHFFDKRAADVLANEVAKLIERRVIDTRSPAADALLDYRDGWDRGALWKQVPPAPQPAEGDGTRCPKCSRPKAEHRRVTLDYCPSPPAKPARQDPIRVEGCEGCDGSGYYADPLNNAAGGRYWIDCHNPAHWPPSPPAPAQPEGEEHARLRQQVKDLREGFRAFLAAVENYQRGHGYPSMDLRAAVTAAHVALGKGSR